MNLTYNGLNEAAKLLPAAPELRNKIMAAGIACAVAARLPLPSGEVADVSEFWNYQACGLANDPLSDILEGVVFDLNTAIDFTRTFWMLRYSAAYPRKQFMYADNSPYGFFDTLAGVSLHVGEEAHTFVNQHKLDIFHVAFATQQAMDQVYEVDNG